MNSTFYAAFIDEMEKICQQIAQVPIPELKERELFRQGTEFQRGQFQKEMKAMARAPTTHISQIPQKPPPRVKVVNPQGKTQV